MVYGRGVSSGAACKLHWDAAVTSGYHAGVCFLVMQLLERHHVPVRDPSAILLGNPQNSLDTKLNLGGIIHLLPLTKINRNSLTFCPPHPGLIEIVFDLSARGRLETVYLLPLHSFPEGTRNSLRGKQDSCFLYSKDSSVSCCCFKELGSQVAQVGLELARWLRMMNF